MQATSATSANQQKVQQARAAWSELLALALERGFFGSVSLELIVQDGTIQHLRRRLDQMER